MTQIPMAPPAHHPEPSRPAAPDLPSLLLELESERDRLLWRQAILISIIVHIVLILSAPSLLKIWPHSLPLMAPNTADLLKDRNLTFVEMPPDNQRVTKRPDTNIASDKDRIATSRRPIIDRKTLDALRSTPPPGAPGAPGQPSPLPPQAAAAAAAAQPAPSAPSQSAPANQSAHLEGPPSLAGSGRGVFSRVPSAGTAVEEATRAAAAGRGSGGSAGGFGFGAHPSGIPGTNNMEILSDTMGVDFGPYLERVLQVIRTNWYAVIPESAYPPLRKKGRVTIQFAILPDGRVAGLHFEDGSGDVALDRAAYAGITASNPFPQLPAEFKGQFLALRIRFYYNPDRSDLR